ncbi:hypothetical protein NT6N_12270 [Oceaniferula spumae]|uniref:M23ase beta-sheet core domain-containing protein n=1 Tax=Oceaniferula spumae TaxID=2979115 RepID=A0AAT9FJT2_9BACT
MKQRIILCGIAVLFIVVAGIVIKGFIRSRSGYDVPVKSMATWQQADAALGYPLNAATILGDEGQIETAVIPEFDPRLIQLSAFERATVPTATRMSAAMGSEHGALTYNAQPFWSDNAKRGGHHTGDDFNGIGGMNTDLGDPVYAVANGLAVYRGEPSSGWGNTLILAHRGKKGELLLSMYSHLDQIHAPYGSIISRGETIGTVGTANLNYPAHLHLEMHNSAGVHIGRGYTSSQGDRIDPVSVIAQHSVASPDRLHAEPLAIVTRENLADLHNRLTIKNQSAPDK